MHRWVFSKASLWILGLFLFYTIWNSELSSCWKIFPYPLSLMYFVCDSGKTSEQLEQLTLWQLPKNYHCIVEHKTLELLLESDGFTPAKSWTCSNRIDSLAYFNAKAGKRGQELNFPNKPGVHYVLPSASFCTRKGWQFCPLLPNPTP